MVERVENEDDRREFRLRLTRKGRALYEELIPRLLRKEQEILSCLSAQERKDFARAARQDREEPRSGADQPGGGRERGVLRLSFRDARLRAGPESIRIICDYGFRVRRFAAPRNDDHFANDRDGARCSANASTLSLARG